MNTTTKITFDEYNKLCDYAAFVKEKVDPCTNCPPGVKLGCCGCQESREYRREARKHEDAIFLMKSNKDLRDFINFDVSYFELLKKRNDLEEKIRDMEKKYEQIRKKIVIENNN